MNNNDDNIIYIESVGGIGNKLKNIVSGMILSEQTKQPLVVHWSKSTHCECDYGDLFEQPYIDMARKARKLSIPRHLDSHLLIDYQKISWYNITECNKKIISQYFEKFKPVQELQNIINRYVINFDKNSKTVGLHYRYDNEWTINRAGVTEQMRKGKNFADDFIEKIHTYDVNTTKFFISAANMSCIDLFKDVENTIFVTKDIETNSGHIGKQKQRTKQALMYAVIDLYLLSLCDELIITPGSTFSECAWYIGGCKAKVFDPISKDYII